MNIWELSKCRIPGVQVAMGPLSLAPFMYTQPDSTVRSPTFGSHTDSVHTASVHTIYRNCKERFVGGVQIRTAGVQKCHSLHIVCHRVVNIREWSKCRTPSVQGEMGPLSLVQFVDTQPTKAVRNLLEAAVEIRPAGVHKCRSLQIVIHGIVNMLERYNGRTPGVQGTAGPPSLEQLLYKKSTGTVRDRFEGIMQIRTGGV